MFSSLFVSQTDHLLRPSGQENPNYSTTTTTTTTTTNGNVKNEKDRSGPPSPWLRKPPGYKDHSHGQQLHGSEEDGECEMEQQQHQHGHSSGKSLERHLSLWDLISIGLGATIGSGIFVLCGMIAHEYAGPWTFVSWAIAGLAASCSGLCYAELAGTFPSAGSSYAYAYVSMGELPAVLAAACLTLEFTFSASAVARSWGDKLTVYLLHAHPDWQHSSWLQPGYNVSPLAFLVSSASVLLLLYGVEESKSVTNLFTLIKVALVLFMAFGALYFTDPDNWTTPTAAATATHYTMSGVVRGATSSFFGYIGFDEICCVAGEAINPAVNLPRAVLYTLLIVTCLYMLAAIALTGMVPSEHISDTSAFPDGFRYRGIPWAAEIAALGEIFTLPLVVWVTIMAQPRLQYAMAMDGLLPPIFAKTDSLGNLYYGTLIAGIIMTLIATFVPFLYLDDLISAGILLAFSMTDSSVILLRHANPDQNPYLLERLLSAFHIASFLLGLVLSKFHNHQQPPNTDTYTTKNHYFLQLFLQCASTVLLIFLIWITNQIVTKCPKSCVLFGGAPTSQHHFQTPMVPFLPLLGIWINWYLIAQLELSGLLLLLLYMGGTVVFYFQYGVHHSIGNTRGWGAMEKRGIVPSISDALQTTNNIMEQHNDDDDENHTFLPLQPTLSLPRVHHQQQSKISDFHHRFSHLTPHPHQGVFLPPPPQQQQQQHQYQHRTMDNDDYLVLN